MIPIRKYADLVNSDLGEQIEEYILRNKLQSGDRLPSERELSKTLDVSRMTLRDSIKKLCNVGTLEIIQGKGTFVARKRTCHNLLDFSLYDNDFSESKIKYKLISIVKIKSEGAVSRHLDLSNGIELYSVKRLHIIDTRRAAIETVYFTAGVFASINEHSLESMPLFEILQGKPQLTFKRATIDIRIGTSTFEEAEWLGISEGGAVTLEKKTLYDANGIPGAYVILVSPAQDVYFYADLTSKQNTEQKNN